jgi:pimeloyl-ACP methyl ester carboxylesterase
MQYMLMGRHTPWKYNGRVSTPRRPDGTVEGHKPARNHYPGVCPGQERDRAMLYGFRYLLLGVLLSISAMLGACTPVLRHAWNLPAEQHGAVERGSATPRPAGEVISVEPLSSWPRWVLWTLFWWQDLADRFPLDHGIHLYRVTYWSQQPSGEPGPASGLLALPTTTDLPLKGLVSWQHGTATLKAQAPSSPDLYNGIFAAAIFAGAGYALVAPDYPGFGVSTEPHAYYHTPSITASVLDLTTAARSILDAEGREIADRLYLTGFSQGGHASYAAHRAMESSSTAAWTLAGTAAIAGPLDLPGTGFPNAIQGSSKFSSLYIAWIALSYSRVYGLPLTDVLLEPWASRVVELFDGSQDGAPIIAALPDDPADLLTTDVISALQQGTSHWFINRLTDNSIIGWTPHAPVRSYFGNKDVDVPSSDAVAMAERATAAGASWQAISLGDFNHDESILAAAPLVLQWFESLARDRR